MSEQTQTWQPGAKRPAIKPGRILRQLLGLVAVSALALVCLIPFWYMVVLSLARQQDTYVVLLVPHSFQWTNYVVAWQKANLTVLFRNSLAVTVNGLVLTLFISSLAAYAFARLRFYGRDIILNVLLLAIMIPGQTVLIPLFLTMKQFHLLDTLYALILCYTAFGMIAATFILTGFFRGVPQEILDQAKIDGCSHWGVYICIMMPLARPAIATVSIFLFLSYWNELILAMTFIQSDARKTVPLGMINFVSQYKIEYGQMAAALAWATIPVLIVYIALQKQFIKGLTAGALKA
jgi:raffinose/stachyose/melibiose transport system permease protein